MRYLKRFLLLVFCLFFLVGCDIKSDNMEGIDIYTTIYPIHYLTNYLYGDYAKIYSIYPAGVDIDNYELSSRKLKEYSNSDLFIFNSLDIDKDYAVDMINNNSELKIIDVSLGMNYTYSVEEIWLDPSNYLMMGKNVSDGLSEYISNPYLIETIENNYENLKYDVSKIDASLKDVVNNSDYDTIVVDNDLFKFLEKYGIIVISLEDNEELSTNTLSEVKKLINDGDIKYIYSASDSSNEYVNDLIKDYKVELITFNTMRSVDGGITNSNDNYLTIMDNNIDLLKKELYK